ncbi:hypothetical protein B0J18DRAFT_222821 [Chaetomium sp. MPI-SDFR-AT-0129]|nr:hypothetical protein B0J18DRAFT_222821 [Chaetomium sp. MPI-SDFR-AT-0129]
MADFEAPPGPPPPKVPEGWTARYNEQYKEWFYVNLYTKKSQWDKPTEPAPRPNDDGAPAGPPPSYSAGDSGAHHGASDAKVNPYDTNPSPSNPAGGAAASYINSAPGPSHSPQPPFGNNNNNNESEDERLARQLQAEEDARARGSHSNSPYPPGGQDYNQGGGGFPGQLPPREEKSRGLLGKLLSGGKKTTHGAAAGGGLGGILGAASHGGHHGQHGGYPGGGHAPYGGPPAPYGGQPGYGGYPPQQPGYGGYGGPPGGGYYPPQQGYYPQQQQGALIADAIHDDEQDAYQDGFRT